MEDFNNKLLESVKSGEVVVAENTDGQKLFVSSRYAEERREPKDITGEVIVVDVTDGQKQLPGNGQKLLEGPSTSFAPQLLAGEELKQLPAPQEEKPAAEQKSEVKKDGAAKPKKANRKQREQDIAAADRTSTIRRIKHLPVKTVRRLLKPTNITALTDAVTVRIAPAAKKHCSP